ncbi:MAG: helix-turn-helix transcriptional regulator [Ruminococcaceae bacterium]|nr:helix-turn-helix transcriptional regulator [Oscillospiraceae bacterium]
MDIGNQIKALRLRRGVTQDAMAQHFGVTPQAVSKWERGESVPDVALLPELSAYFGVSIDELFALSDETHVTRIENMLNDVRFIEPADVEKERAFLLNKAQREPEKSEAFELLAELELHLADEHKARAAEYAQEALRRDPESSDGYYALVHAGGGKHVDLRNNLHSELISDLKERLEAHSEIPHSYVWLVSLLLDDRRFDEAKRYCERMEKRFGDARYPGLYATGFRIRLALAENDRQTAKALWEKLGAAHPQDWSIQHDVGDFQTLSGDYAAAKESYRRAIDLQKAPRYTDPVDSLAKVCEMDADFAGAIEARRLELEILSDDWHVDFGEGVDKIKRDITRLEAMDK